MYKVELERAARIISCLRPNVVFVYGPRSIGKSAFCSRFKSDDYSVLDLVAVADRPGRLAAWLRQTRPTRYIVELPLLEVSAVDKLLDSLSETQGEQVAHVWLYPNNAKNYATSRMAASATKGECQAELETNRQMYAALCEAWEDRVFTVLV